MTLSHLLKILRGRWKFGLSVWLSTLTLAIIVVLAMTPQYTSTAAVVVDSKAIDPLAGVVLNNNGVLPGNMATQADVAKSSRVVLAAVRAMKLSDDPVVRDEFQRKRQGRGSLDDWLVKGVQNKYVVTTSRDSNALTLSFSASEPDFAAEMANALMKAHIETTLEMRIASAKQYNQFFETRSKQLRDLLQQAQGRLAVYQQANGLLAADRGYDVESARLSQLNTEVATMQSTVADTSGRQRESQTDPQRMQEVQTSPVVVSLTTELARADARIQELKSRLGESNPQVLAAQSNADELRSRLRAATSLASAGIRATNGVARDRLSQAVAALEAQRSKVMALKSKQDGAAVLQRNVESAQQAYESALLRLAQTEMESESRQSNVSVLEMATPGIAPNSPKSLLIVAAAAMAGLLLAVLGSVALEMINRRLRSEEDVTLTLGQSLLIVVPRVKLPTMQDPRRLDQIKARVLSGLANPGKS